MSSVEFQRAGADKFNEINDVKYICKKVLADSYFDPVLSGEIFEYIYNYLKRINNTQMIYFQYNDDNKYIDIKFENTIPVNDLYTIIDQAFANLYVHLVQTTMFYNRLLNINIENTIKFTDTVMNKIDLITGHYPLYTPILLGDDPIYIRIILV